ncbi:MAG: TIM barrel protein [Microscillaceae bacterium]|nr:TIM barrel protein [Microscillaceae bacterium]
MIHKLPFLLTFVQIKVYMFIGMSSFTYGWNIGTPEYRPPLGWTESDLVDVVCRFGFNCLQIGDNLPLHTFSVERMVVLKNKCQQHAIRLEIGAREMTEENLILYLDLCQSLEVPLLRFVIDAKTFEPTEDEIIALLKNALPELEKKQITLGIENHDRFKAKNLSGIMDKIGHEKVGICLDCANSLGAGEGLEHITNWLAPHTVNLHLKDFKIQRLSHQMGFIVEGAPLGQGMLDLNFLSESLFKYGRCQSVILEQWVVPESEEKTTLEKEKTWANESIRRLSEFSKSLKLGKTQC